MTNTNIMSPEKPLDSFILPAKTRALIASEYNVDVRTLKRWLRLHNIFLPPGTIPPRYQREIYEKLGIPPSLTDSSSSVD